MIYQKLASAKYLLKYDILDLVAGQRNFKTIVYPIVRN